MTEPGKDQPSSPGSPSVDSPALVEHDVRRSESFAVWVEPEIEMLLRVARSLTGSWADAEDVVQETLIRAYAAIDGFDGRHPRAWLLTILRRTHLNSLRRSRPVPIEDESLERRRPAFGQPAAAASPEALVGDRVLDDDIESALLGLDERFQAAVLLVDVHQLTYAEAAGVLDVPLGTLMSRLSRGRARLRKQLPHRSPRSHQVAPVPDPDPEESPVMGMTTCWWAARRLDRYLDADPSAQLSTVDGQRIERHVAACRRCATDLAARREVHDALREYGAHAFAHPAALERLDRVAARLRNSGPETR